MLLKRQDSTVIDRDGTYIFGIDKEMAGERIEMQRRKDRIRQLVEGVEAA